MGTVKLNPGKRSLALSIAVAMSSALLVTVAGVAPAIAGSKLLNFQVDESTTLESSTPTIQVVLTYTGPAATPISVTITAVPETASASDYTLSTETITFPPDSPSGTVLPVPLTITPDGIYEEDEVLTLTITGVTGGSIGSNDTHQVTIVDDDDQPTLSISDAVSGEADGPMTFTITRTGRTAFDATFDVATLDIDATAGLDYTGQTTTLTIAPGGDTRTETFTVPIIDDDIDEATEAFLAILTNPVDATPLKATGTGTIADNDKAGVTVNQLDGIFLLEGGGPDTFSLVLQSEPTAEVVITLTAVADQLAVTPSELTFDSTNWATALQVNVTAIEDGIDEEDPHTSPISFSVASVDTNYNGITLPNVTATVGDADALLVTIDGPSVGVLGESVTFTAIVNAGGTGTITYDWTAFQLGNPIATADRATFDFTPAEKGAYIIQAIVGDGMDQNPATFLQFKVLGDIADSEFVGDIIWLTEAAITKGCNPPANDEFCPNDFVTRGQIAAFLVRFLGLTDDDGGNTFTDDDGSIFENDIERLATAGITRGCNPPVNDRFCPTDRVTREQMAAFLVRALGLTDNGGGNKFTDDDGSIFEDDIAKLATAGITRGCNPPDNTQFCPTDFVTRGQMAAFLRRADNILNP